MNQHEIERIAASANQLRPDWPVAQLKTLLSTKLADRPRRDVAVALAWIACEQGTATPYRVLEAGPWWKAVGIEGTATRREPYDAGGTCSTCSLPHDQCRTAWADDHQYVSVAEYVKTVNRDPERIARIIESIKGQKAPPREPSTTRETAVEELDHDRCDATIDAATAAGNTGRAEYLATRCDRAHGHLTQPTDPSREATP